MTNPNDWLAVAMTTDRKSCWRPFRFREQQNIWGNLTAAPDACHLNTRKCRVRREIAMRWREIETTCIGEEGGTTPSETP
jgi:hypothetical protein